VTGFIRSPYVHVGAVGTAAIVALGLVTAPPERYDSVIARTEFAAVQLQAVVATQVAAFVNTAPRAGTVAADPSASTGNSALAPSAAATAAASTAGDAFTSIGRVLLNLVGSLTAPIWWLGFPITLPLYLQGGTSGVGFLDFLFWMVEPFFFGNRVFPVVTPAPAAATRVAASAMVTPDPNTVEVQSLSDTSATATEPAAPAIDAVAAVGAARASATGDDNPFASLGRFALNALGTLLSPIWWLAFPITLPLFTQLGGASSDGLITLLLWFAAPLRFGNLVFPETAPVVAAAQRATTPRVAEVTAGQTANASATVPAPAAETTEAVASNNKRQRAATARAREVVQPTATASSVIAANTPEAINTPASAAPPAARKSRTARADKNTTNADSGKRTGQATAAAQ
jgi:hypothetical protein